MWDMNDVVKIFYKGKYTYNIVFDNGVSGDVDFSKYIKTGYSCYASGISSGKF
mgnify:CR=1 FL=1